MIESSTDANAELMWACAELAAAGSGAALLSSLANVTYASQWEVPVPFGAGAEMSFGQPLLLCLPKEHTSWLIVPDALATAARATAAVDEVIAFETFDGFRAMDSRVSFLTSIKMALAQAGLHGGPGVLGVEQRTLPLAVAELLAAELPAWRLADAEGPLDAARRIKTDREIALLRRAAALGDIAQETLGRLSAAAGQRETAMWGEIAANVYDVAGREIPLVGELVTGPRTTTVAYPNGPRPRTTEAGDAALMDLSGRLDGYWFDCTNTFVIGEVEPAPEQVRYGRAAQAACEAAMNELRPGKCAADAAAAAASAFAKFGLPVAHYTGHQIGVTVNERPRLVPYDRTPIEPGMVFAVEPGAYQGPGGTFGARAEKMVLVTESGPEILSTFRWGI